MEFINDVSIGGYYINYSKTKGKYGIYRCHADKAFPLALPTTTQKTWTIKSDRVANKIVITCNGVEVVNVALSDDVCTEYFWRQKLGTLPTEMMIYSSPNLVLQVHVIGVIDCGK